MCYSNIAGQIECVGGADQGINVSDDLSAVESAVVDRGDSGADTTVVVLLTPEHFKKPWRGLIFSGISCYMTHIFSSLTFVYMKNK